VRYGPGRRGSVARRRRTLSRAAGTGLPPHRSSDRGRRRCG
jgi:hypothetical protein